MALFRRHGIEILDREVVAGASGRYRLDFRVAAALVAEFDGFTYHWSPEAKARDEARRNRLRLDGYFVLVYTWQDLRRRPSEVATEILEARRRVAA